MESARYNIQAKNGKTRYDTDSGVLTDMHFLNSIGKISFGQKKKQVSDRFRISEVDGSVIILQIVFSIRKNEKIFKWKIVGEGESF